MRDDKLDYLIASLIALLLVFIGVAALLTGK